MPITHTTLINTQTIMRSRSRHSPAPTFDTRHLRAPSVTGICGYRLSLLSYLIPPASVIFSTFSTSGSHPLPGYVDIAHRPYPTRPRPLLFYFPYPTPPVHHRDVWIPPVAPILLHPLTPILFSTPDTSGPYLSPGCVDIARHSYPTRVPQRRDVWISPVTLPLCLTAFILSFRNST